MDVKKVWKEVALWVVTALLIVMFVNAGIRKFPDSGGWTKMFRRAGFPDWFRIAVGVWETAAAALLLFPRTAAYGAAAIVIVMIGAIGTNVMLGWTRGLISPSVALVLATVLLIARWRQRARINPSARLAPQQ